MATTGRSGQASLAGMLNNSVSNCFAAFEYPDFRPRLPGALGDLERLFRRRFIETHELLGRGRVIDAYDQDNQVYLAKIAARRLARVRDEMSRRKAKTFIDVSKYFIRGIHHATCDAVPDMSMILLLRNPLENMRSFLNREKNFRLDNSLPNAPQNLLRLDAGSWEKGELYLWCWFEIALRYQDLLERHEISMTRTIWTEDLNDGAAMAAHFTALGLQFDRIEVLPPVNTNVSRNLPQTSVGEADRHLLDQFLQRLPSEVVSQVERTTGFNFSGYSRTEQVHA